RCASAVGACPQRRGRRRCLRRIDRRTDGGGVGLPWLLSRRRFAGRGRAGPRGRLPVVGHRAAGRGGHRGRLYGVRQSQVPHGYSGDSVFVCTARIDREAGAPRHRLVRPRRAVRVRPQNTRLGADSEPLRRRHTAGGERVRGTGGDGADQPHRRPGDPALAADARPTADRWRIGTRARRVRSHGHVAQDGDDGVRGRRLACGGAGDARARRDRLGPRAGDPARAALLHIARRRGHGARRAGRRAASDVTASVASSGRETFASRLGTLMTIIGVAIGLGNVWRFPYMVGKFGGAAFVLFYVFVSIVIGVPALMAEFALGRASRRGPVGAFEAARLPFGRAVGWFFFAVVIAATGYYTAVIGWVLYYAVGQLAAALRIPLDASAILPPDTGFVAKSFVLQLVCTAIVILTCALVVIRGLRAGIERASKVVLPMLLIV